MQYKGITMITSKLGKIKTTLQLITIHLILIFLILKSYSVAIPDLFYNESLYILMILTTLTTFYTGVHYFYYNYKTLGSLIFKK